MTTNQALLTPESVTHILSIIRVKGTDAWFSSDFNQEWIAPEYRGHEYRRGTETMDVWFDSGTSWSMLPRQADIYLEGTDQHRGWFQSSLLTSMATKSVAPFKTLITHGFVLDTNREKMSKSLGNIISPKQIVEGKKGVGVGGVDGLRMWVASAEYTTDISVSDTVLTHVLGGLQKIRATLRFLIGNLHAVDVSTIQYSDLSKVFQL
jgi:isoleucyl-tRNA synthetase